MQNSDHAENYMETAEWMRQFAEAHKKLKDERGYDLPLDVFHKIGTILVPERAAKVFVRKPCRRALKYIGYDNWDESERSELNSSDDDFFEYGKIYYSTDFNGATYSIEGYSADNNGRVIGCAFFEWVKDDAV